MLGGQSVAVNSTTLEADAALKSIIRRNIGEDWCSYVIGVMWTEGLVMGNEEPSEEEIRHLGKNHKGKKESNEAWVSGIDAEAKIGNMNDGTRHVAYKAEHVVDLESGMILGAVPIPADMHDK